MKSFPYWNLSMLNQAWPWTQRRNYESQTQTNHQRHVASQAIRGLLTDIAVIRSSRQVPLSPSAQHFTCCFHTSLTIWLILLGSFHVITKSQPFCLLKHNKHRFERWKRQMPRLPTCSEHICKKFEQIRQPEGEEGEEPEALWQSWVGNRILWWLNWCCLDDLGGIFQWSPMIFWVNIQMVFIM